MDARERPRRGDHHRGGAVRSFVRARSPQSTLHRSQPGTIDRQPRPQERGKRAVPNRPGQSRASPRRRAAPPHPAPSAGTARARSTPAPSPAAVRRAHQIDPGVQQLGVDLVQRWTVRRQLGGRRPVGQISTAVPGLNPEIAVRRNLAHRMRVGPAQVQQGAFALRDRGSNGCTSASPTSISAARWSRAPGSSTANSPTPRAPAETAGLTMIRSVSTRGSTTGAPGATIVTGTTGTPRRRVRRGSPCASSTG